MKQNATKITHLYYGTVAIVLLVCLIGNAAHALTWALLMLFGVPLSLALYAVLHEQYHIQTRLGPIAPRDIGLLFAATIGFSFQIYTSHHRNHHQHGDGPRDYSTTRKPDGTHIAVPAYLKQHAMRPFALQLIPFFSIMTMQQKNRSAFTFVDEGVRIGFRLLALWLGGFSGFIFLLAFQLLAITTIMTLNYYQHQGIAAGRGRTWETPWFNRIFLNLGLHDQHHLEPARPWHEMVAGT